MKYDRVIPQELERKYAVIAITNGRNVPLTQIDKELNTLGFGALEDQDLLNLVEEKILDEVTRGNFYNIGRRGLDVLKEKGLEGGFVSITPAFGKEVYELQDMLSSEDVDESELALFGRCYSKREVRESEIYSEYIALNEGIYNKIKRLRTLSIRGREKEERISLKKQIIHKFLDRFLSDPKIPSIQKENRTCLEDLFGRDWKKIRGLNNLEEQYAVLKKSPEKISEDELKKYAVISLLSTQRIDGKKDLIRRIEGYFGLDLTEKDIFNYTMDDLIIRYSTVHTSMHRVTHKSSIMIDSLGRKSSLSDLLYGAFKGYSVKLIYTVGPGAYELMKPEVIRPIWLKLNPEIREKFTEIACPIGIEKEECASTWKLSRSPIIWAHKDQDGLRLSIPHQVDGLYIRKNYDSREDAKISLGEFVDTVDFLLEENKNAETQGRGDQKSELIYRKDVKIRDGFVILDDLGEIAIDRDDFGKFITMAELKKIRRAALRNIKKR